MPKKNKKPRGALYHDRTKLGISFTKNFPLWIILWVGALIFTQALRGAASNILFGFVSIIPFASLVYAIIARLTLKIFMLSDSTVTEKNKPFTYEFRIINESLLPYPFIDAYIKLPRRDSVRTAERCVRVSMAPASTYTVKGEVHFRFRGTYEIGVSEFYVYDFLRLFRVRCEINNYDQVYVLPRKLILNSEDALSVSDSASRTRKAPYVYDRLEVADIRDYRPGDSLKSIHWKLSSKSEEFVVNDYNTGCADVTYIFCDMAAHFPDEAPEKPFVNPFASTDAQKAEDSESAPTPAEGQDAPEDESTPPAEGEKTLDELFAEAEAPAEPPAEEAKAPEKKEKDGKKSKKKRKRKDEESLEPDVHALINDEAYEDMNEYCADGAVELTVAVVLRELRAGRDVTLMWYDDRSEIGAFSYDLHTVEDFDTVFRLFASAPIVHAERSVSRLAASVGDTKDAKLLFVLPVLDDDTVADICAVPRATEVIAYSAEERYLYPELRRQFIEGCREQFAAHGMKLIEGKLDDDSILGTESALKDGKTEFGGTVGFGVGNKKGV